MKAWLNTNAHSALIAIAFLAYLLSFELVKICLFIADKIFRDPRKLLNRASFDIVLEII